MNKLKDVMNGLIIDLGWVNIGDGMPTYMRYDFDKQRFVVLLFLKDAYYDLYNEWVDQEKMTIDQLRATLPGVISAQSFNVFKCKKQGDFEKWTRMLQGDGWWHNNAEYRLKQGEKYEVYDKYTNI